MNKKNIAKIILKLLICLIIASFILFIICPLFINFLVNTPNPFGLGFIDNSNRDSWINFFGAIISGSMTLLGVLWTIKDNENKRKEELSIQYRPIFICKVKKFDTNIYYIKLTNVGRSEAEIKSIKIVNIDSDPYLDFWINNYEKPEILVANDSFECLLFFNILNKNFYHEKYEKKIILNYFNPITSQNCIFEKNLLFDISNVNNLPFITIYEKKSKHYFN